MYAFFGLVDRNSGELIISREQIICCVEPYCFACFLKNEQCWACFPFIDNSMQCMTCFGLSLSACLFSRKCQKLLLFSESDSLAGFLLQSQQIDSSAIVELPSCETKNMLQPQRNSSQSQSSSSRGHTSLPHWLCSRKSLRCLHKSKESLYSASTAQAAPEQRGRKERVDPILRPSSEQLQREEVAPPEYLIISIQTGDEIKSLECFPRV